MIENILESFVCNYIDSINHDFFNVAEYYKRKNDHHELDKLNQIINKIYKRVSGHFNKIININKVKNISQLEDMHSDNNCTILVEYHDKKIIYKPFHSHFIKLINELLFFLNSSKKFNFYCIEIMAQNKYGSYIEYIENEPPKDIKKFSYHYGAIIFILTLLRGTDFHSDNILCKSSIPIIVDYETLFFPEIHGFKDYSVEATSLIKTKNNNHTVMNNYELHMELLIEGIDSAYKIVKANTNRICSLINKYYDVKTRVIFKPTSYYLNILKNSTHPLFLSCKKLRKKYLTDCLIGEKNILSFIIKHEVNDLLEFNIPIFYFEKENLYNSKKRIINQNLILSSFNLIHHNLKNLNFFKSEIIDIIGKI